MIKGRVNSFQSLGAVDGPGIRFVVFMQGCNLRCGCCHNPDTWEIAVGEEYTPEEIVAKVKRYKEYFGENGGITISGGEPLLQSQFVSEVFKLCHNENINTCLDTSGSVLNDNVKELLTVTDHILLDIKYTNEDMYKEYVGCSLQTVLDFLEYVNIKNIPVTLRQVIIPGLNYNEENMLKLKDIKAKFSCVKKIELLPFKKLCSEKYQRLGVNFAFDNYPEPQKTDMLKLEELLGD